METKPQTKQCKIKCPYGWTCSNGECVRGKFYSDEMLAQLTLYKSNCLFKNALHLNYISNIYFQVIHMLPTADRKERGVDLSVPKHAAMVQSVGKREEVSLEDSNVWTKVRFFVVPINMIRHNISYGPISCFNKMNNHYDPQT